MCGLSYSKLLYWREVASVMIVLGSIEGMMKGECIAVLYLSYNNYIIYISYISYII